MKKRKNSPKRIKIGLLVKRLAQISMLITILVFTTSVHAGNKDSTLVRNQVDGIYAIAPLSDKTHLYNLEMYTVNGKTAYCIEIGKKITSTIYNSTTDENEQINISKLTKKQLDYIKLLSYFGYKYPGDLQTNPHNTKEYYMATQELIWEYLNNIDITWTNELDINGPKINIDSYKNEILNLAQKYTLGLTYPDDYSCTIGQTNKFNSPIISYYKVLEQGHQNIFILSDRLEFKANENYIGKDKIILTWNNLYSYKPAVYNINDSQTLLSTGSLPEITKTINLEITGETLETSIIDKDTKTNIPSGQASLIGATYELYDEDNSLIDTFTTNESSKNYIKNLYHKNYYIKQIKASKGYKINSNIINFKVDKYKRITLEEEVIKSDIEINKLYEINDNFEKEEGITFNIYDNNNNLYNSITTTKTGIDKITLPYGKYTIKQNNTTYGYEKVEDIELTINDESKPIIHYELLDKKIKTKLHITTKDKITNNSIKESNIKYKIKDKTTNKYLSYIDINNKKTTEFSTNNSGELTIPIKLSYGNYLIEQITPPSKYLENKELLEITINDKSTYTYIDNEVVVNVDFLNIPITGKLNITTSKEIVNDKNIINKEIKSNTEVDLYLEDKLINTYTTNDLGIITIDNLSLGNYCIIEKDTNNKKCIDIINKDNKTKIIEKNIELIETINKINVIINNIDENNNPISDSEINLYKDNTLIDTYKTNSKGHISINNLPIGNYCFKQTKVPSKYIINNNNLCFEVTNDSKNMNFTIKNKLNKTIKIPIPNTLSNIKYAYISIPLLLLIGVIYYKKKNTNN